MFHPASLILIWGAALVVIQQLALMTIVAAAGLAACLAWRADASLTKRLFYRSRWLFLTMLLLFVWLTPGVRLPAPWGAVGMTRDGLSFAAEHIARLAAMLALLVLLLSKLDHRGIVAGIYLLLSPLRCFSNLRRSVAVRLMLTLEEVAEKNGHEWKSLLQLPDLDDKGESSMMHLTMPPWTWRDVSLVLLAVALAVWGVARI